MGERARRSPRFEDEGGAVIIMWEKRRKVEVKRVGYWALLRE